jgi:hypothetical protein
MRNEKERKQNEAKKERRYEKSETKNKVKISEKSEAKGSQ